MMDACNVIKGAIAYTLTFSLQLWWNNSTLPSTPSIAMYNLTSQLIVPKNTETTRDFLGEIRGEVMYIT